MKQHDSITVPEGTYRLTIPAAVLLDRMFSIGYSSRHDPVTGDYIILVPGPITLTRIDRPSGDGTERLDDRTTRREKSVSDSQGRMEAMDDPPVL